MTGTEILRLKGNVRIPSHMIVQQALSIK